MELRDKKIGFALTGSFCTFTRILDVLKTLKEDYGIEEKKANDYGSVLLNLSIRVGDGIGPLLGGMINNVYNFDITCAIMCFMNVVTGGIFCIYVLMKKRNYIERLQESLNK